MPDNFWTGGRKVQPGDRVSFSGQTGAVKRIADRKRGPTIVVKWDRPPARGTPSYFWPDDLTLTNPLRELRKRRGPWPRGRTPPHLKRYLFK